MQYFDNFNENEQIRKDANSYETFHNDLNELISDFIKSTANLNLNDLYLEIGREVYDVLKKGTLIKQINGGEFIYGIKIGIKNTKNCGKHMKIFKR